MQYCIGLHLFALYSMHCIELQSKITTIFPFLPFLLFTVYSTNSNCSRWEMGPRQEGFVFSPSRGVLTTRLVQTRLVTTRLVPTRLGNNSPI